MRDDFLILHPRKKIGVLKAISESIMCIIWAKVVRVINKGKWWYLECKCRKPVAPTDGIYHCTFCSRNIVNVVPRYKIHVEVYDFNDSAYLTLDYGDVERILKKTCKDLLDEVEDPLSHHTPLVIKNLVGKQMLFKVLKIATSDGYGDDVFKVDRIYDDVEIVRRFFTGDALLVPQRLGSNNGLVEYKFIPLLCNCKAGSHSGSIRGVLLILKLKLHVMLDPLDLDITMTSGVSPGSWIVISRKSQQLEKGWHLMVL